MKPELLLVSPLPPRVTDALKDDFVLHDYYRADDKPAMLKEVGPTVRAFVSYASAGKADAAMMDAAPNVELIANWGVGYDRVDIAAAKARGIIVTNTPDVLTECCADLAMALILAAARSVAEGDRYVRAGNWKKLGNLHLDHAGQRRAARHRRPRADWQGGGAASGSLQHADRLFRPQQADGRALRLL